MSNEGDKDALLVATAGSRALVRVMGRGSFKVSHALKKFHTVMMERGVKEHVLDMTLCAGLDSTFMGVLAGVALRLRRQSQGELVLVNVSGKIGNLLETLGLSHLITAYAQGAEPESLRGAFGSAGELEALETEPADKKATTITMLEAHRSLIEASPGNLPKFKDVLEYLKEDLRTRGDSG